MDLLQAHQRALTEFDTRVTAVTSRQWGNATPCTQWTVRDLVNHVVTEQLWVPWLLDGATLSEVGDRFDGDQLGPDPVAAWSRASELAHTAWTEPGATTGEVNVTGGVLPAEDYGWQLTLDLTVHAWDLARGISADERLDPDLVAAVHTVFAPQVDAWQDAGIFAPPQPVSASAGIQDRLLALLGRQP